jgi:sulfate adenylyltransferase subunit 1
VKVGQRVVLPSGVESAIARIVTFDGDLQEAGAGEAVTLVLKDEIDISRGDLLVDAQKRWRRCRALPLMWCGWLNTADAGQSYDIKIAGENPRPRGRIQFQVDINNLTQREVTDCR